MVCWMTEASSLRPGTKYAIKHTTRSAGALVQGLRYRVDINTLHRETPRSCSSARSDESP